MFGFFMRCRRLWGAVNLNEYKTRRVILLLHVKRPVRFPGSIVADLFLWAVRKSPFVQDALRNLELWNSSPHERAEKLR